MNFYGNFSRTLLDIDSQALPVQRKHVSGVIEVKLSYESVCPAGQLVDRSVFQFVIIPKRAKDFSESGSKMKYSFFVIQSYFWKVEKGVN